ncbi:MAG: hypothetical protein K0U74_00295, partial [Alphaproteobacteria bacterium]|nr:hypothetical protein [Alphaproteobacteria bacterium]
GPRINAGAFSGDAEYLALLEFAWFVDRLHPLFAFPDAVAPWGAAASRDLAVIGAEARRMYPEHLKLFYIYITASAPRGVLYVGMTSDLPGRIWEH